MNSYRLTFITPLFSKGSYDDRPEIRPPSIRGQLHWWFRALGGSHSDEKAIFGGVHGGTTASKVVVRVNDVIGETDMFATLPHKSGVDASFKRAFKPGVSCAFIFPPAWVALRSDFKRPSTEHWKHGSCSEPLDCAQPALAAVSDGKHSVRRDRPCRRRSTRGAPAASKCSKMPHSSFT